MRISTMGKFKIVSYNLALSRKKSINPGGGLPKRQHYTNNWNRVIYIKKIFFLALKKTITQKIVTFYSHLFSFSIFFVHKFGVK